VDAAAVVGAAALVGAVVVIAAAGAAAGAAVQVASQLVKGAVQVAGVYAEEAHATAVVAAAAAAADVLGTFVAPPDAETGMVVTWVAAATCAGGAADAVEVAPCAAVLCRAMPVVASVVGGVVDGEVLTASWEVVVEEQVCTLGIAAAAAAAVVVAAGRTALCAAAYQMAGRAAAILQAGHGSPLPRPCGVAPGQAVPAGAVVCQPHPQQCLRHHLCPLARHHHHPCSSCCWHYPCCGLAPIPCPYLDPC
jgi:hypothetical protein